jgi:hypothetical protein
MPRGNIQGRLEKLEASAEATGGRAHTEAWERAKETLDTLQRLILEHGDEIDRSYKERVGLGEDHKAALIDAKREALQQGEEGRRAWAEAQAFEHRGGRGVSYGAL